MRGSRERNLHKTALFAHVGRQLCHFPGTSAHIPKKTDFCGFCRRAPWASTYTRVLPTPHGYTRQNADARGDIVLTHNLHTTYTRRTYDLHTTYIRLTYDVHTTYTRRTYDVHTTYIRLTYDVHTTYTRLTHDVHTTYIRRTHDVHTTYIRRTYDVHTTYIRRTHDLYPSYHAGWAH
jgi:hypothetical protein